MNKADIKSLMDQVAGASYDFLHGHEEKLTGVLESGDLGEILDWIYDYAEIAGMETCGSVEESDEFINGEFDRLGYLQMPAHITQENNRNEYLLRLVIISSVAKITQEDGPYHETVLKWIDHFRRIQYSPQNRISRYLDGNQFDS